MLRLFLKIIPLPLQIATLRLLVALNINNNRQTKEILRNLEGKEMLIQITDIGKGYSLSVKRGLLRIDSKNTRKPDIAIRGDTTAFSGLFTGRLDPDSLFFSRAMKVDGDVTVLVLFKNLFEAVR